MADDEPKRVDWYRTCRGVESGAHSLHLAKSRTRFLRRARWHLRCTEEKCDLDIRTVYPRFIWLKNRGETVRLFIVCSWPGRQVKKRRWVRVALQLYIGAVCIGILCVAVTLLVAWTSGILK